MLDRNASNLLLAECMWSRSCHYTRWYCMLYFKLSSILMLDVSNNSAPPSISDMFTPTGQVHKYNTRSSSSGNFYRSYSRLSHHKNLFASIGVKIWSSIPANLKKLPKHTFKTKIHNLSFLNLQNQDSYADIDNFIYEIKKTPSWNILFIYIIFFTL